MPLFYFLLLVVSFACGSLPPLDGTAVAESVGRAIVASLGMVAAWAILCHVAARIISQHVLDGDCDAMTGADVLERQLEWFRWLGLAVAVLCLAGFGLGRGLDALPGVGSSLLLQSLILLAPGVLLTAATWTAEHHYGVRLGYTERGGRGYLRTLVGAFRSAAMWLLAPVLLLLLLVDVVGWLPVAPATAGWITAALVLAALMLGFPWLVRYLFKSRALRSQDLAWIEELLAAAGVRKTHVMGWDTGSRSFNAMVAGFVPPMRTLLISDRLVDEMPRDQLAMVVLHEAAHRTRRHVPLRMLALLPAWGAAALVSQLVGDAAWAMPLGSVTGILLTLLILKSIAYRTEHDADLHACRLAARVSARVADVPRSPVLAARALSEALQRVASEHPAIARSSWLHPGVAERIAWVVERTAVRNMPPFSRCPSGTILTPEYPTRSHVNLDHQESTDGT